MREWTLRKDGCSNTITTVTKDNYIFEATPICIDDTYGFDSDARCYKDYCPTLRSSRQGLKVAYLPDLSNICINDKGKINKPPQITYGYAPTLVAEFHGNLPKVVVSAAMRGRYDENGKVEQHIETRFDEFANAVTTVSKDSMVMEVGKDER